MADGNLSILPKGWVCTSLNEVSEIILEAITTIINL